MTWVQTRRCDGECCRESPRWPNAEGTDCIYHDADGGCKLMKDRAYNTSMSTGRNVTSDPQESIPLRPGIDAGFSTALELFEETCVNWPHNISRPDPEITGGCCWQWVDDGN